MTPDQAHLLRVKSITCRLCVWMGLAKDEPIGQSDAHHIGDSSERDDWLTVALCPEHHRGATGFHGLGEREFNRRYRTNELALLASTLKRIYGGIL